MGWGIGPLWMGDESLHVLDQSSRRGDSNFVCVVVAPAMGILQGPPKGLTVPMSTAAGSGEQRTYLQCLSRQLSTPTLLHG